MATITQTVESANAEGKPIRLAVAYDDKVHNAVSSLRITTVYFPVDILIRNIVQICGLSPSL